MTTPNSTPPAQPPASVLNAAGWNRRTLTVAAFVGMFLAWQIAVPTVALFADRPARFGWQMYSARPDLPKAWIIDASGVETPIEMKQVFAQLRAEVNFAASLRSALCHASGAMAVKIVDPRRSTSEVLDCP